MNSQGVALGIFVVLFASSMTVLLIAEDETTDVQDNSPEFYFEDPCFKERATTTVLLVNTLPELTISSK